MKFVVFFCFIIITTTLQTGFFKKKPAIFESRAFIKQCFAEFKKLFTAYLYTGARRYRHVSSRYTLPKGLGSALSALI